MKQQLKTALKWRKALMALCGLVALPLYGQTFKE